MKNIYIQLSSEERDKIAILRAKGLSLRKIAQLIGRDKSTISRELKWSEPLGLDTLSGYKLTRF